MANPARSFHLNVWSHSTDEVLFLPRAGQERGKEEVLEKGAVALPGGIRSMTKKHFDKVPFWNKPEMYPLATFSEADFGTEEELRKDRIFIARKNLAAYIQKCADEEFEERKDAVAAWYSKAVQANSRALLKLVAAGPDEIAELSGGYRRRLMGFGEINDKNVFDFCYGWGWGETNPLGTWVQHGQKWLCCVTGAKATYRAAFSPRHLSDIMLLTGLPKEKIPDVLHEWGGRKRHSGNHLLRRIDPVETDVCNPWNREKLKLVVNIYLSKRGYARVLKGNY